MVNLGARLEPGEIGARYRVHVAAIPGMVPANRAPLYAPPMNRQLSLYMDAVRFLAACLVFIAHFSFFLGKALWRLNGFGHESVIVFFVLSGYVISYATSEKEKSLRRYVVNRVGRIYSVALPAIFLTFLCDRIGAHLNPELYRFLAGKYHMNEVSAAKTIMLACLFLTKSWRDVPVFSNIAYWSLCYEVWYYVLFAALKYARGIRRGILSAAVLAIIGPTAALYLVIWMIGVATYGAASARPLPKAAARVVFAASLCLIFLLCLTSVQNQINGFVTGVVGIDKGLPKDFYQYFGSDLLLALAFGANLYAFANLGEIAILNSKRLASVVRTFSSYTFSIYLYHVPLVILTYAVYPYDPRHPALSLAIGLGAFVPIVLLSQVTEQRKEMFRTWIEKGISGAEKMLSMPWARYFSR